MHIFIELAEELQALVFRATIFFSIGNLRRSRLDDLPAKQLLQDIAVVELAVRLRLRGQSSVGLELLSASFDGWHATIFTRVRLVDKVAEFFPVKLRSQRVVPFLHWLVLQVIDLKEIECGLIPAIY